MSLSGHLAGARESLSELKRQVHIGLQRSLHYSGVARIRRGLAGTEGFLALMYHGVTDARLAEFVDPAWSLPVELFEEQLQLLSEHCHVISLEHALGCLEGHGSLPERAVVLTFDDGYLDNLELAAPLLRKYAMPAAIFIATGFVDRQEPQWIDELYASFRFRTRNRLKVAAHPMSFDLSSDRAQRHAYLAMAALLLKCGYAERRRMLDEIKAELAPDRDPPRLTLSWDDVRTIRRDYPGIELGVHAHDHVDLATLPLPLALAEVQRSQQRFQEELGFAARFLSYPYGRYYPQLRQGLREMGIQAAFKTQPTDRVTRDCDPWGMPRYEVSRSLVDFRLWTEGCLPSLGRRMFGQVVDQV